MKTKRSCIAENSLDYCASDEDSNKNNKEKYISAHYYDSSKLPCGSYHFFGDNFYNRDLEENSYEEDKEEYISKQIEQGPLSSNEVYPARNIGVTYAAAISVNETKGVTSTNIGNEPVDVICNNAPQRLTAYGYIYNVDSQVVPIQGDVSFNINGNVIGISHIPGTAPIILDSCGDYAIWFTVAAVEQNQFTLYKNNAPVGGSTYGSGDVTQPNSGMVIITAEEGDVLTLRNHTSQAAVTLQIQAGGSQINANASILIYKLN
jgi:hypothetical protein